MRPLSAHAPLKPEKHSSVREEKESEHHIPNEEFVRSGFASDTYCYMSTNTRIQLLIDSLFPLTRIRCFHLCFSLLSPPPPFPLSLLPLWQYTALAKCSAVLKGQGLQTSWEFIESYLRPRSSQLTEPLWTDPFALRVASVCAACMISTLTKKFSTRHSGF